MKHFPITKVTVSILAICVVVGTFTLAWTDKEQYSAAWKEIALYMLGVFSGVIIPKED